MAEKTVSDSSTFSTLRNLWPYMWPADRADLRARVTWATFVAWLTQVSRSVARAVKESGSAYYSGAFKTARA